MFGKKKCGVCGHRFTLDKERVYTATEQTGIVQALTSPARAFDMTDCPKCGCQIALAVRLPREKAEEDAEETAQGAEVRHG